MNKLICACYLTAAKSGDVLVNQIVLEGSAALDPESSGVVIPEGHELVIRSEGAGNVRIDLREIAA